MKRDEKEFRNCLSDSSRLHRSSKFFLPGGATDTSHIMPEATKAVNLDACDMISAMLPARRSDLDQYQHVYRQ